MSHFSLFFTTGTESEYEGTEAPDNESEFEGTEAPEIEESEATEVEEPDMDSEVEGIVNFTMLSYALFNYLIFPVVPFSWRLVRRAFEGLQ